MFRCLFHSSKKRTFSTVTTHNAVAIPLEASIQHHKTTPPLHSSFHYDTFLCNTHVNVYVRAGDLVSANKLFDEMPDRNSFSWAALISGYIQNGMFSDGCGMFREMVCSGSFPNHYAIGSVLRSCQEFGPSGHKLGMQIHGLIYVLAFYSQRGDAVSEFKLLSSMQREGLCLLEQLLTRVKKSGLVSDLYVGSSLVNGFAGFGCFDYARKIFEQMSQRNVVSMNGLTVGLVRNKHGEEATELFVEMKNMVELNVKLYVILSNSFAEFASLEKGRRIGKEVHGYVICSGLIDKEVAVGNGLINILGWIMLGQQVHGEAFKLGLDLDVSVSNALLALYADTGCLAQCLKVFSLMPEHDQVSWNTIIGALSVSEASISEAVKYYLNMMGIHAQVIKYHIADHTTIENALLACYGKCGEMDECEKIFSRMSDRKDDVSWNSMISGYIHEFKVDMYSKCGRIEYALRFFDMIPIRNVYSWNLMILGYACHGHGDKALRLFPRMKLDGPPPNHVTFVGVLSACSHVGMVVEGACGRANGCKTELGRKAADMLFEMEPQNAVNYVLLTNMYSSGGKWEDVARVRKLMREAEVKKEAGCSWVTMKDGDHVFVAGDKSHPEKDLVYEKLKELNLRDAGYVPQTKYALYDLDQENKEELLGYHSERLAVAFVLTRNSGLPVRIMKNLRICVDCHSAFKFI
ncbi:hypothetical protein EZV62_020788 [Acer yangbiense]|uniref:DYW domain-containing protein n=1 Tax=Acer yangbiense TaxID=1000413 RepID=A0A5C7HGN6_9ROSI|nr:hypothetical protein EZV62_020788 [Acer yangbiense]